VTYSLSCGVDILPKIGGDFLSNPFEVLKHRQITATPKLINTAVSKVGPYRHNLIDSLIDMYCAEGATFIQSR